GAGAARGRRNRSPRTWEGVWNSRRHHTGFRRGILHLSTLLTPPSQPLPELQRRDAQIPPEILGEGTLVAESALRGDGGNGGVALLQQLAPGLHPRLVDDLLRTHLEDLLELPAELPLAQPAHGRQRGHRQPLRICRLDAFHRLADA